MNDRDDSDMPGAGASDDVDGVDALDTFLDHLLAGADPAGDAPAWSHEVALLVEAARAPAQDDELDGEHEIVSRMIEVRRAAATSPVPALARTGTHDDSVVDPGAAPAGETATSDAAGVLATVTRLADHRSGGRDDRHYRAKHAAARLEASRHPAIRTVGRVLAMKAVAVTTVAVVGVAAAAATTGIVATVVVPAFTEAPPEPKPTPTTERRHRTTTTSGAQAAEPEDRQEPAACPTAPTCATPPSTAVGSPTTTVAGGEPTTPTTDGDVGDGTAPATSSTVATSTTSTTIGTQTTTETTTTSTTTPDPSPSTFADGGDGTSGSAAGGTP